MSQTSLAKITLRAHQPISDAVACIDASGGEIALVIDESGRLLGTITDGDIRRGILNGATLETGAGQIMNSHPRTASVGDSSMEIAAQLVREQVDQMPIVDANGVLVDLILAQELTRPTPGNHPVVIMAGGLGTRLRPITETIPKPMIPVGGRPILEIIIERFAQQGFTSITLCVNHLAEVIEGHFEDGHRFGVDISYVRETQRMGTAGALSLLPVRPSMPVIVMNGDILTAVNFNQLLAFHRDNNALATMATNRFQYQIPYGVVEVDDHNIRSFVEKPVHNFFVNAGIYVINPEAVDFITPGIFFDMPSLFEMIPPERRVAFPIHEYWLDIGRHNDLEKATREFDTHFGAPSPEQQLATDRGPH